jgi:hypothetical protein
VIKCASEHVKEEYVPLDWAFYSVIIIGSYATNSVTVY